MDLIVKISGEIQESNFAEYKDKMLAVIDDINTDLQSDEDFSAAEITVKHCRDAEKAIDAARDQAMANTADIEELFKSMTEVSNKLQETRLSLSKQIKTKKEDIKADIVAGGIKALSEKMAETKAHPAAKHGFIVNNDDFDKAVKGKRTVESMQKAVDTTVAQYLNGFGLYCDKVVKNQDVLEPYLTEYPSLFVDENTLLQMEAGSMVEIIHSRIRTFKAEEEARKVKADAEAKKEQERKENEAKAKTEPPEEKPKPHAVDTLPPRQQRVGRGVNEQLTPPPDPAGSDDNFVMTVVMLCPKEKAIEIAQTVNKAIESHGSAVVSVNLTMEDRAA